jgi:protein-arginine kinase activator protein McsA
MNVATGLDRREKKKMFRCDNCGSGYSAQAASSWTSCPRCLAKDKVQVPLTFELGWQRQRAEVQPAEDVLETTSSQPTTR